MFTVSHAHIIAHHRAHRSSFVRVRTGSIGDKIRAQQRNKLLSDVSRSCSLRRVFRHRDQSEVPRMYLLSHGNKKWYGNDSLIFSYETDETFLSRKKKKL